MIESSDLRLTRMPLNSGAGWMPALGCGLLISDAALTKTATRETLDAWFRHFDVADILSIETPTRATIGDSRIVISACPRDF